MSHPQEADIAELLSALVRGGVEFIVVGGAAAVIHGAPITTEDLDIVHRRTPDNVDRLLGILERLDAFHRHALADRRIKPTRDLLLGTGQVNLSTRLGPLDPLCELDSGVGYDELLPYAEEMTDGEMRIRVLKLDKLIELKSATGRDKDRPSGTLAVVRALRLLEIEHLRRCRWHTNRSARGNAPEREEQQKKVSASSAVRWTTFCCPRLTRM